MDPNFPSNAEFPLIVEILQTTEAKQKAHTRLLARGHARFPWPRRLHQTEQFREENSSRGCSLCVNPPNCFFIYRYFLMETLKVRVDICTDLELHSLLTPTTSRITWIVETHLDLNCLAKEFNSVVTSVSYQGIEINNNLYLINFEEISLV